MAITNGNTWLADMVGDISGKIEEFCLDVEDVICMDAVNYVESKLKKVGGHVKSLCLEFVREVFPSSQEQVSEEVLSDMPPLESTNGDITSDTAKGVYLEAGSCSINNYSDVDCESCGDATQDVPISQAEALPLKSEDRHERPSLMEGLGEDFNGLDTCSDRRNTVKSLLCVIPEEHESISAEEEHGSIRRDVASSNELVEAIGLECSVQEPHSVNELIKLDESCIMVDTGDFCSAQVSPPNEIIEQQLIQIEALENMTSTMSKYEYDESEWEII